MSTRIDYYANTKKQSKKLNYQYKFAFLYEPILISLIEELEVDINEENFQSTLDNLNQFSMNVISRSFKIYMNNLYRNSKTYSFNEFYINYVNEFKSNKMYSENFYSYFPGIISVLERFYYNTITNYKETLAILNDNKFKIMTHFNIPNFYIRDIKLGIGDQHEDGKSTTLVKLDDTFFYIKWRENNFEKCHYYFYSCLKENIFFTEKYDFMNTYLEFDNFYIQKEIKNKPISNPKKYFENVGVFLFATYVLKGDDFHYENLISTNNEIVSIDSETIFQNSALSKNNVFQTTLLPSFTYNGKYVAGLSNNLNGLLPTFKKEFSITSSGIAENAVSNQKSKKEKNIPFDLKGNELYFCCNVFHIINGFKKSYKFFLENKNELIDMILKLFNGKSTRFLKHQTNYYANLLWTSYSPKLLLNEDARKDFFKNRETLSKKEIKVLNEGHIPLLQKQIDLKYSDFDFLTYLDMHNQVIYIKESYDLESRNLIDLNTKTITHKTIKKLSSEFFNKLLSNTLIYNKSFQWIDTIEEGNTDIKEHLLIETTDTIYYGKSGLYLYILKYILHNDGFKKWKNRLIFNDILFFIEYAFNYIFNEKSIQKGMLDGAASILKLILEIHSNKLKDYSTELVLLTTKLSNNINDDINYDYTSGSAGLLNMLTEIYYQIDSPQKKTTIKKNIDLVSKHLVENFTDNKDGCGWKINNDINFGYAHGIAGILPAIYKAYLITNNRDLYLIMNKSLDFLLSRQTKDSLWPYSNNDDKCLMNWCHGLPGVLLSISQLYLLGVRKNAFKKIIINGLHILKKHSHNNIIALCHGQLGNDYIGLFCSNAISDSDNINFFKNKIKVDMLKINHINIHNKSFMNGLSGIFYFAYHFNILD